MDEALYEQWRCPECGGHNDNLLPCDYCGELNDRYLEVADVPDEDELRKDLFIGKVKLWLLGIGFFLFLMWLL